MKKLFFALAAITLLVGPVLAQEKVTAKKKKEAAACEKKGEGKSCCMPSKAAAMKTAGAVKKAKPAAKG